MNNANEDEKYIIVRVSEILSRDVAVPVSILKSNYKNLEAEQLILNRYKNGDIVLDSGDFINEVEVAAFDEQTEDDVEFCRYPIIRGDN